jgi:formylglycine-generating enzyme required for sulfatase activity
VVALEAFSLKAYVAYYHLMLTWCWWTMTEWGKGRKGGEMPKCYHCGAEIDSLYYTYTGLLVWNGNNWEKLTPDEVEYRCPECGEEISLDALEQSNSV